MLGFRPLTEDEIRQQEEDDYHRLRRCLDENDASGFWGSEPELEHHENEEVRRKYLAHQESKRRLEEIKQ